MELYWIIMSFVKICSVKAAIYFYPSCPHLLSDMVEIQCKVSVYNAGEYL